MINSEKIKINQMVYFLSKGIESKTEHIKRGRIVEIISLDVNDGVKLKMREIMYVRYYKNPVIYKLFYCDAHNDYFTKYFNDSELYTCVEDVKKEHPNSVRFMG